MLQISKGDNLIKLTFTVVPKNTAYDLTDKTVKAFILKPDKAVVEKGCLIESIENRTASCVLLSADIDQEGVYYMQVVSYGLDGSEFSNSDWKEKSFEVVKTFRPLL